MNARFKKSDNGRRFMGLSFRAARSLRSGTARNPERKTESRFVCAGFLALLLMLGSFPATADTLSDLKVALGTLRGTTPIRASIDIQRSRKSSGRFANHTSAGRTTLALAEDESGLHIVVAADVLARAARESHEREADPQKATPTRDALDETQPTDLAETIDFAGPLLDMLAIGQRTAERRVVRDGRSVRLLTLKLTPKLPPEAVSVWHVRFNEDRLDIWIGDDNVPLAAERVRSGSAGFLFLRGDMKRRDSWTFAHVSDRLVVVREESSYAASGLGQRGEGRDIRLLTIR